jgi:hypothetical protein
VEYYIIMSFRKHKHILIPAYYTIGSVCLLIILCQARNCETNYDSFSEPVEKWRLKEKDPYTLSIVDKSRSGGVNIVLHCDHHKTWGGGPEEVVFELFVVLYTRLTRCWLSVARSSAYQCVSLLESKCWCIFHILFDRKKKMTRYLTSIAATTATIGTDTSTATNTWKLCGSRSDKS